MDNILYVVFENSAEGKCFIESINLDLKETIQSKCGSYGNCIFECRDYSEAKEFFEKHIEDTTKFEVFKKSYYDYTFGIWEEEYVLYENNCNSGTYKENDINIFEDKKIGEFYTKEEAIRFINELKEKNN